jgi:ParB-like chromosome segregation protein Spo0J
MILEDHPAAAMFPLLQQHELEELAKSILDNGQRRPIVLLDGKIVDGRNRYRATQIAKVPPVVEIYDAKKHGTDVFAFVLDHNLYRRHLSTSQRAMIAAEALKVLQQKAEQRRVEREQQNGAGTGTIPETKTFADGTIIEDDEDPGTIPVPSQESIASLAGVSERTMSSAVLVAKEDPELANQVKAGTITVNQAEKQVKKNAKAKGAAKGKADELDPAKAAAFQKERREAIKRIRTACGESFAQAFLDQEVLKTIKETAAFLALDDATMTKVAPLVATGWAVNKAAAHVTQNITGSTTVDTLINRAISAGGTLIFNHEGYEVAITKI